MARGRTTHRRRRGRFSFLLKLFCAALIIAAVIGAITLFFKTEKIVVEGNQRYTEQQVIEAAGLQLGSNLYLMNKYDHAQAIFRNLPYVESASINRKLPDTLLVEVKECTAAASIPAEDGTWLMSINGKLLEKTASLPEGCAKVTGCMLVEPEVSGEAAFDEDSGYKLTALRSLLNTAEEKRMRADIETVDLGDDTCLQFTYAGRFAVKLPWTADFAYKLESLATVADYLEANETGTINLMTDGKASFTPE